MQISGSVLLSFTIQLKATAIHQAQTNITGVIMELLKIIIAILLPPLGVFMQVGIGKHFWLNILLTILGYIPGIIHAIWVIAKNK